MKCAQSASLFFVILHLIIQFPYIRYKKSYYRKVFFETLLSNFYKALGICNPPEFRSNYYDNVKPERFVCHSNKKYFFWYYINFSLI